MADNRYFYQDFLFAELPVDKQDNPIVEVEYINQIPSDEKYETISLDRLLRMDKLEEWDALFGRINESIVYMVDDVPLCNNEVLGYKDFYLKTYYYNVSRHCKECYVVMRDDNRRKN